MQILSIISDNGANMVKSTKILSQLCAEGEEDEANDEPYENAAYLENLDSFQTSDLEKVDSIEIAAAQHTQHNCAHLT